MKQTTATAGLVKFARMTDQSKTDRATGRAGSVLYAWYCKTAKMTDEAIGEALTNSGVSLKRAQAGKLALIGRPIHAELRTVQVDASDIESVAQYLPSLADEVAALISAMEKVITQGGKGARDTVRNTCDACDTVADAVEALQALIEPDDAAAVLLAKIAKLVSEFVDNNYVPTDLDAMTGIVAGVRTMEGRC